MTDHHQYTEDQASKFAALVGHMLKEAQSEQQRVLADLAEAHTRTALSVTAVSDTVKRGFADQATAHGQLMAAVAKLDDRVSRVEEALAGLSKRMDRLEVELKFVRLEEQMTRRLATDAKDDHARVVTRLDRIDERLVVVEKKIGVG